MVFCNSNYPAQQCLLRTSDPLCEVYPVDLFQDFSKKIFVVLGLRRQWRVRGSVIPACGGRQGDTAQLQADGVCPRSTWEMWGCVREVAESRWAKRGEWVVWKAAESSACKGCTSWQTHLNCAMLLYWWCPSRNARWGQFMCPTVGRSPAVGGPPGGTISLWGCCRGALLLQVALAELWKHKGVSSGSLFEMMVVSRDVACDDFSIIGKSCPLPVLHFKCKHMHTTPSHMSERFPARQGRGGHFLSLQILLSGLLMARKNV